MPLDPPAARPRSARRLRPPAPSTGRPPILAPRAALLVAAASLGAPAAAGADLPSGLELRAATGVAVCMPTLDATCEGFGPSAGLWLGASYRVIDWLSLGLDGGVGGVTPPETEADGLYVYNLHGMLGGRAHIDTDTAGLTWYAQLGGGLSTWRMHADVDGADRLLSWTGVGFKVGAGLTARFGSVVADAGLDFLTHAPHMGSSEVCADGPGGGRCADGGDAMVADMIMVKVGLTFSAPEPLPPPEAAEPSAARSAHAITRGMP